MKSRFLLLPGLAFPLLAACDPSPDPAAGKPAEAPAAPSPAKPVNPSAESLVGKSWIVEDIENKGVIDNARTSVRFDSLEKVSGSGGINKFSGSCTLDGEELSFGPMRSTKMAGPPALMNQEAAFHEALRKVRAWKTDEKGTLFFLDEGGASILRMTASTDP